MEDTVLLINNTTQDNYNPYSLTDLSVETIESERGFDAIRDQWERLVERLDVHVFQTYEWQRTWWKFFGGKNDLRILLFYHQNELVGIMPMFVDHFRLMGSSVYRCLRMIGSRVMQPEGGSFPVDLAFSDYLSWIVLPDYEEEAGIALREYLDANSSYYDEIILEEVPGESTLLRVLRAQLSGEEWICEMQDASKCPLIKLPKSWNDLLLNLSSNARYQIRRFVRRATQKKMFELHTAQTREEVARAFDDLVEFHQTRWHNLGQPGIFMDKRIHDFFREITMRFHEKGWLCIKTATAGDRCVAVDLLFSFKEKIYLIQRGYDDTSEYKRYSPGKVLLYTIIKEGIDKGFRVYDFLRGDERYKLRTATHIAQNKMLLIRSSRHNGDAKVWKSQIVRTYTYVQRKVRNERDILHVYTGHRKIFNGMRSYMDNLCRRSIGKLRR